MTKTDRQSEQLEHADTGAHLGGTHFGQAGGDAKTKDTAKGGDKARPNDGKK